MTSATLVDTNVLLDVFTNDQIWADWSIRQLGIASAIGSLAINGVIYAELSVRFATIEALDRAFAEAGLVMTAVPNTALFLAGKAFQRYRASGGARTGVLPDFFIGAHATVAGITLLTRTGSATARTFRRSNWSRRRAGVRQRSSPWPSSLVGASS